jgi:HAD superfamily hydrolase (TIGR01509 family)
MAAAVILDIDGTLVDTNYHHALAWYRAFRQNDVIVPVWRIHRAIGMGGDQLIAALAGDEVEEEKGDDIRDTEKPLYMAMIEEVAPFEGAKELVRDLSADRTVVLASSAKEDEVDHYLDLLDARKVVAGWTTSADVEETKPEPDLVEAALKKALTRQAVLVGDSVWDCEAAKRAGIESVAVLTGGYAEAELKGAGAREVLESVADLGENPDVLDEAGEPS